MTFVGHEAVAWKFSSMLYSTGKVLEMVKWNSKESPQTKSFWVTATWQDQTRLHKLNPYPFSSALPTTAGLVFPEATLTLELSQWKIISYAVVGIWHLHGLPVGTFPAFSLTNTSRLWLKSHWQHQFVFSKLSVKKKKSESKHRSIGVSTQKYSH